jgi:membrane associated rhomboid family serine protease
MNGFFGEINRMLDRFLTPAVKIILVVNVAVFMALLVMGTFSRSFVGTAVMLFGQYPIYSLKRLFLWQFVTYMFVHIDVMHVFFNMATLWFFAPALENRWGSAYFWRFYLITGAGAGVFHAIIALLTHHELVPVIGASGAIFGVMLAYAAYFPDQTVWIWGAFPMKIKHLMILMALFGFLAMASGREGDVSNLTHLSGLAVAYGLLGLRHKNWDVRVWRWKR